MSEEKPQPQQRKPYQALKLVKLGTVADLTLAVGSTGAGDGGKSKSANRTR